MREYLEYFADCYVIINDRTTQQLVSFLDRFLPKRKEGADQYELPQYDWDSALEFDDVGELLEYLQTNPTTPYGIYWNNLDKGELIGAMCFFTQDANLILGLSCKVLEANNSIESNYFEQLKTFSNTNEGYITYENPPPLNKEEFLSMVKNVS